MNTRSTRIIIIIIGLAFLIAVAFGIIWKPIGEKQAITDYLASMTPVAQAHIDWIEDNERTMDSYSNLSHSERVEVLNKLLGRIEEIQIDIQESNPPDKLSDIKKKWNKECWQFSNAIYTIIIAMNNGKPEQIPEASKILIAEANRLRQEWTEELSALLDEYDIEIADFPLDDYHN